jgi:asparagine synthase (glutamine-hydrolysing)
MCGIVGFSGTGELPDLQLSLRAIAHRGPDDFGLFRSVAGDCCLGHVRLSILDLSDAGHQPMFDSTGRYAISYNGEIYNFQHLKQDLERRHGHVIWKSSTDTEIIIEGFARDGAAFLDRLNGIFAVAIYDTFERKLFILRDPIGVKPLFITEQFGGVFLSSELKGLLALPKLKRTLRRGALADQLTFMYVPEPLTMYEEFRKLEPGVLLTYREGRQIDRKKLFLHLDNPIDLLSEAAAIECLKESMALAVRRQLVADVPVSIFLSGGLDSSAIAHYAVEFKANITEAYTIAFSNNDRALDGQSDDLYFARLMAQRLGLNLRIIPAEHGFMSLLPELIEFMEDGFTDPAAINTYLIAKAARESGVKVMLSGQGADEYLGGYRRYQAERFLSRVPLPFHKLFALVGQLDKFGATGRLNATFRRVARLGRLAAMPSNTRLLGMYSWTAQQTVRDLFVDPPDDSTVLAFQALFETYADGDIVDAMLRVDQQYDLMGLNLCYTDRMSMAAGVEVRVPFLDFDLVRVMKAIPLNLKLRGLQGKYILRKAMEPHLPREVIYRGKAGFGLPLRAWLSGSNGIVREYLSTTRITRQGIFRPDTIERIISQHMHREFDHANTIFTLLCQQIWLDEQPA